MHIVLYIILFCDLSGLFRCVEKGFEFLCIGLISVYAFSAHFINVFLFSLNIFFLISVFTIHGFVHLNYSVYLITI